ncbi:DUF1444 family protein [Rhizobium sp. XQZ8]|uniref:DUF1444 family protein n=1 Tax=Rhizobium populisoli TaxID=2859785 RepID=UPI001CA5EBAB|nr:DUF1444 family protein [Rhizobium populisoli]MBW6421063.1 DUF1444 family protein [Rhizobium populisoli]
MNIGALGTLCAIGGDRIARARILEDDSFKQEVIEVLRRHHPEWVPEDNADPMLIAVGTKRISLDNNFLIVRDMTGGEREDAILDFLETTLDTSKKPEPEKTAYAEAKDRLMPQIVPAEFKNQLSGLMTRPFLSGLDVGYVLDEEKRYSLLRDPVLAAWHIHRQALETQAFANLEALAARQELVAKQGQEGALFAAGDDSFAAARLLLPDFMARVRKVLNAPHIFVGIPNRDFILAWSPDFSRRKGFAKKIAEDLTTEPYPLTADLFVSSDAGIRLATAEEAYDHGR